jgi:hypothetical protein
MEVLKEAKQIIDILKRMNRDPFLVGGTALWAYRNNSLPGGQSKSFGLAVKDIAGQPYLYNELEKLGFTTKRIIGTVVQAEKSMQYMVYFLMKELEESDEWYSYRHHVGRYLSVPDKFMKLEEIDFMGMKVKVPSPIEDYLLWTYGKEWKDPTQTNKSFPPARVFNETNN